MSGKVGYCLVITTTTSTKVCQVGSEGSVIKSTLQLVRGEGGKCCTVLQSTFHQPGSLIAIQVTDMEVNNAMQCSPEQETHRLT